MIPNWTSSSADPSQISATVSGAILGLSALIIFAAAHLFHIVLSADDVTSLASGVGAVAGSVWMVYGLIRKLLIKTTGNPAQTGQ
jgi:hypothetical protein